MGSMFRVLIEGPDGETVVDLTAPVDMLRQFAPAAVGAALGVGESEGDSPAPEPAPDSPGQPRVPRRRRTKAEMEAVRAAEQHPAPEISTDPIPAEVVPDVSIDRNTYNPFGPK